jgi:hypothetical protein
MATQNSPQTPFDDEISLLDIIHFFKANFKRICLFAIMGGILGLIYGKLAGPIYNGQIFIEPAKYEGKYVNDQKALLSKLKMNLYFSKETFLTCGTKISKNGTKDLDYKVSTILEVSIPNDSNFLKLQISGKDKKIISDCLNSILNDIESKESIKPLILAKRNQLQILQKQIQENEDRLQKILNNKQPVNAKGNDYYLLSKLKSDQFLLEFNKDISGKIEKLNVDLNLAQTKDIGLVTPIEIERKKFPSKIFGGFLGLFLGSIVGIFICLLKKLIN